MLVLSRRLDEVIVIGEDLLRITVVSVEVGQVKLGITAPKSLSVHREEVWNKIQEEKKNAARRNPAAPQTGSEANEREEDPDPDFQV